MTMALFNENPVESTSIGSALTRARGSDFTGAASTVSYNDAVELDDSELEATTMVLVTDLALIAKTSAYAVAIHGHNLVYTTEDGQLKWIDVRSGKTRFSLSEAIGRLSNASSVRSSPRPIQRFWNTSAKRYGTTIRTFARPRSPPRNRSNPVRVPPLSSRLRTTSISPARRFWKGPCSYFRKRLWICSQTANTFRLQTIPRAQNSATALRVSCWISLAPPSPSIRVHDRAWRACNL